MPKATSALCIAFATLVFAGPSASGQQTQTVAQTHLSNARTLLQNLPAGKLSTDNDDHEDAVEEVTKLRRQFDELTKAFDADPESSTETGWKLKFSEIERTLARLVGGGSLIGPVKAGVAVVVQPTKPTPQSSPAGAVEVPAGGVATTASNSASGAPTASPNSVPATAGTVVTTPSPPGAPPADTSAIPVGTSGAAGAAAPVGTSGSAPAGAVAGDVAVAAAKVSTIGIKRLDPGVRRQLEMFRTEIELFYVAPVGERSSGAR